jgi:hypothetical protein
MVDSFKFSQKYTSVEEIYRNILVLSPPTRPSKQPIQFFSKYEIISSNPLKYTRGKQGPSACYHVQFGEYLLAILLVLSNMWKEILGLGALDQYSTTNDFATCYTCTSMHQLGVHAILANDCCKIQMLQ